MLQNLMILFLISQYLALKMIILLLSLVHFQFETLLSDLIPILVTQTTSRSGLNHLNFSTFCLHVVISTFSNLLGLVRLCRYVLPILGCRSCCTPANYFLLRLPIFHLRVLPVHIMYRILFYLQLHFGSHRLFLPKIVVISINFFFIHICLVSHKIILSINILFLHLLCSWLLSSLTHL